MPLPTWTYSQLLDDGWDAKVPTTHNIPCISHIVHDNAVPNFNYDIFVHVYIDPYSLPRVPDFDHGFCHALVMSV